jgi:small subunit ribosomal protein S16
MAVKIRLARRGRKKLAMYDVIVADARSPRDGRIIEKLGTYNPLTNPATILIKEDRALEWLLKGAQPTDTAKRILSHKGILLKKHLQVGVLKGAITQEQADKKYEDWIQSKEAEIAGNVDSIAKIKADAAKARFEAEQKVNEAKAEALKAKLAALVPVEVVEEAPAAEETVAVEEKPAEVKAEAPVEEPKAEQAPVEENKEEAPTEEKKEETPTEEPKAEKVPAAEKKAEEAPAEEKKEEAPAEEPKAEEKKAEEAPVEEPKAEEAKAEPVAEKEEAPAEEKKEEEK